MIAGEWSGSFNSSGGEREDQLDFQVNNETYFLDLSDDERQWLVFVETPNGPRRIPVYDDAEPFGDVKLVIEDKDRRKVVN